MPEELIGFLFRQSLDFSFFQIDQRVNENVSQMVSIKNTNTSGFNLSGNRRRAGSPDFSVDTSQFNAIIGNQLGTKRHKLQRQRGFATARRPYDEQAFTFYRDAGRVEDQFGRRVGLR